MANTKKTEAVELTPHEQWQIKREAKMVKRNDRATSLSKGQLRALKQAYITLRHADFSCHEMYKVDAEDMIAIDQAEMSLSDWFPQITEDAVSELPCYCDDDED